jgi:hypothetical protein
MATAPTPGAKRTVGALDATLELRILDHRYVLRMGDLSTNDHLEVRAQVPGRPALMSLLQERGLDTLAVIVWLARRKAGERRLTFKQSSREFDLLMAGVTSGDDIELVEETDDGDDEEEVDADPLGSAGA